MIKTIVGSFIMVAGIFMAFVPPFIFGPILFAVGLFMGFGGMFGMTKSAAKLTVAGAQAFNNMHKENELAARERRLAERERELGISAREQELDARQNPFNTRP